MLLAHGKLTWNSKSQNQNRRRKRKRNYICVDADLIMHLTQTARQTVLQDLPASR